MILLEGMPAKLGIFFHLACAELAAEQSNNPMEYCSIVIDRYECSEYLSTES